MTQLFKNNDGALANWLNYFKRLLVKPSETILIKRNGIKYPPFKVVKRNLGLGWFTYILTVAAIVLLFANISQYKTLFANIKQTTNNSQEKLDLLKIVDAPINVNVAKAIADRISQDFPTLKVTVETGDIVIASKEQGNYQDWMSALHTIPSIDKTAIWVSKDICMGVGCPNDMTVYAKIKGVQFNIESNSKEKR